MVGEIEILPSQIKVATHEAVFLALRVSGALINVFQT